MRSPYPIISLNAVGTPGPTDPEARIVPPTMRNAWTHRSGTNASSRGIEDRCGHTCQRAMSAKATRLIVNWIPKERHRFHAAPEGSPQSRP